MQDKDNQNLRKPITFRLDNIAEYTIRLQEMECLVEENNRFREELEINTARLRVITRQLGIATTVSIDKNRVKRMQTEYKKLLKDNNPVCDLIMHVQEALSLTDKMLYEEKQKTERLQEELRRIRLLAN